MGLNKVEPTPAGGLRIGELVSNTDLAAHPTVYQLELGYPQTIERLAGIRHSPNLRSVAAANEQLAIGYWPWSLLA